MIDALSTKNEGKADALRAENLSRRRYISLDGIFGRIIEP
jgi:hypothetical protein